METPEQFEARHAYNNALLDASKLVSNHKEALAILKLYKEGPKFEVLANGQPATEVFNMVAQAIAEPIREAN
jgi:hypothetical protein